MKGCTEGGDYGHGRKGRQGRHNGALFGNSCTEKEDAEKEGRKHKFRDRKRR